MADKEKEKQKKPQAQQQQKGAGKKDKKPKGPAQEVEDEGGPDEAAAPAPPPRLIAHYREKVVPAAEILERINEEFPLERAGGDGTEPATRYVYRDGIGDVGVIASVSEPFCDDCDRVRLTAEGQFRTCLFALEEFDLRAELRAGQGLDAPDLDDRIAAVIEAAVGTKWAGHQIGQAEFVRPPRSMSQIGG